MVSRENKNFHMKHWMVIAGLLSVYDALAVSLSYFLALLIRFDLRYSLVPEGYLTPFFRFIPFYVVFCLTIFWKLRLYRSIWRFASFNELQRIIVASLITTIFHVVGITCFFKRMPLSYYVGGAVMQFLLVLSIRFAYRFVLLLRNTRKRNGNGPNVLIVGAGNAGQMLARDIQRTQEVKDVLQCFIDDNPNKWGRYVEGVPVAGGRDDILKAVETYDIDKIYVAVPTATPEQLRDILNICKESGCELKNLPGMYQLVKGDVKVSALKEVAIEDLLGREQIKVNMEEIFAYLSGKVVLVTGGGGSIGSEIVRQVAQHNVKQIVVVDIYENNAYDIQQEIKLKYPEVNLVAEIASVRDSRRINQIFEKYKPDVVYHAAAHKHVPLMEGSPCEAIKNNVFGTYKTAYAAMMNGTQRFVLISTDKAVNPTNIMGASKRLCEMIIQSFDKMIKANRESELPVLHIYQDNESSHVAPFLIPGQDNAGHRTAQTEFVAVRFGNVLGSNGSVIPLFKKQMKTTKVLTVTHPDIIRYFMTIPEAVSLVLQAGTYAKGGEIFVLDMGEPVKIDTLARNLIKLSGLRPDVDIKIEYTGLRPGEKLYEEKLMAEEGMQRTANKLIHIGNPIPFDTDEFLGNMNELMNAAYNNTDDIKDRVQKLVTTYHPYEQ